MQHVFLGYGPLENDFMSERIGFWQLAFFCERLCRMDSGSKFVCGGWDLDESDSDSCWPLTILVALFESTLQSVDDAITP